MTVGLGQKSNPKKTQFLGGKNEVRGGKEKLELQEEVFPPSHHLNQYVNRISKSSVVTLIRTCFQMASLHDRSDKNRYYIQTVRTHVTAKLKANNWKGSVEKV